MTQKAALNFCENDLRVPAHLLEIDTGEENISLKKHFLRKHLLDKKCFRKHLLEIDTVQENITLKTFAWGNISLRKKIASENTLRKHLLEIDSVQENISLKTFAWGNICLRKKLLQKTYPKKTFS